MKKKIITGILIMLLFTILLAQNYPIVDTNQTLFYDEFDEITAPDPGDPFYGQDAQFEGNQPDYTDNGDCTITDNVTNLMWSKTCDTDGDGEINYDDKMSYDEAIASVSGVNIGGYSDWRIPTIKELYSLIIFSGEDCSGWNGSTTDLIPFIDTDYFDFGYGDVSAGERIIDAQFISSTLYVSTTMNNDPTMFGVNFADGRIKGYPYGPMPGQTEDKQFYVYYVRGTENYGVNDFEDNGDGTTTDNATELIWSQNDSGEALNWEEALAWVQQKNNENYLGYNDWRLPNVKELQSIIDYTRSPDTSNSAAIDPLFNVTSITNAGGETDYPYFWSGTTHANMDNGSYASYVSFGRALGWMEMPPNSGNYTLMDVHGAGAQRSDPKSGDPSSFPYGHGPQGDVIRIYNYVRLVRDAEDTNSQNDLPETGSIELHQNSPNPFNPSTTISFNVTQSSYFAKIEIYNLKGQKVKMFTFPNGSLGTSEQSVVWDGTDNFGNSVTSGIYFYKLDLSESPIRKMILLK
ncbi:MAG: DUF1566 domain-containing protein [Candidatus Cloacimonetes bacterium]|nr:DUF1566 domain-containing protein [Candidatus Cloacimonadota bacterium]MCF7814233.1 DUF1566 domain-containing protein [Candidatus Cloacimonadota bacterium]MCF7868440.1 DUF1566 domain-containing protein [Candidatus Cloacimonadota bacterium]MCF7883940.1 DUF1566 domain-containing protein [Candidatus Cloacimonadota bacterium]